MGGNGVGWDTMLVISVFVEGDGGCWLLLGVSEGVP